MNGAEFRSAPFVFPRPRCDPRFLWRSLHQLEFEPQRQFDLPAYPLQYALMKRGFSLMPTLARIGLGPVIGSGSHLPGADADLANAMGSTVRAQRNARDELSMLPTLFERSQSLISLADRPLVVLTASENLGTDGWAAAQDRLAVLSSDSVRHTIRSSHAGLVEDQHGSDASVSAITAVTESVRSGSPVATS